MSSGTFVGASGGTSDEAIDVNGDFALTGGSFTSTRATLSVSGDFTDTGGTFTHNSGTVALDGTGQELFGSGGGQALADEVGVPLLARVPLDPLVREAADAGAAVAEVAPDSEGALAIAALAEAVAATRAGGIRKPLTVLS